MTQPTTPSALAGAATLSAEQVREIARTAEVLANTRFRTLEWTIAWNYHINALMDADLLPGKNPDDIRYR